MASVLRRKIIVWGHGPIGKWSNWKEQCHLNHCNGTCCGDKKQQVNALSHPKPQSSKNKSWNQNELAKVVEVDTNKIHRMEVKLKAQEPHNLHNMSKCMAFQFKKQTNFTAPGEHACMAKRMRRNSVNHKMTP